MQRLLLLFLTLLLTASLTAQNWTSHNRKAVSNLNKAVKCYELGDTEKALQLVKKAIKSDASFIEAYILMAEICMDEPGKDSLAIFALEYAVAIDPEFYPANLANLAEMYIGQGRYEDALLMLNRYKTLRNQNPSTLQQVERSIAGCKFALAALNNPVNFSPVNLGNGVNTERDEYHPSVTVDGKYLLFTRADTVAIKQKRFDENLYISQFRDYQWQSGRNMGTQINSPYNEGAAAISPDGQMIVYTMCEMDGMYGRGLKGYGSCDLFYSFRTAEGWLPPMNMGFPVSTNRWESQPCMNADGRSLYFVRSVGKNNSDIFYTTRDEKGNWMPPLPLGTHINTPGKEMSVFIHPDGQTLYFSSDGHPGMGGLDMFMCRKEPNGEWGVPVNMGYPLNTSKDESGFVVAANGKQGYFASGRAGGYGGLDIYTFELDPSLRPYPVTYLRGVVYDAVTTKPLEAGFELIDLDSGDTIIQSWSNPETGDFLISLPSNHRYALNVSRDGYLFYSDHFELRGEFSILEPFLKDIALQPIKKGESVVLRNIFFDLDQYTLKPESKIELDRLTELLKKNPGIWIEIGGHTDNTGTRKHNETLSEERAKAVMEYLTANGVEATRLSYKGYADLVPIADNRTEEGRSQNRRTEFTIIKY
jgi:outer membrane protein OmpA-like peptidoglycan-associated protein